jgi:hypothetical protein
LALVVLILPGAPMWCVVNIHVSCGLVLGDAPRGMSGARIGRAHLISGSG